MNTGHITAQLPVHIRGLFDSYDCTKLLYHNFQHTERVVFHTAEIVDHYELDSHYSFILQAAAWFHDTGQLTGDMHVHEERSVQFMQDFFSGKTNDRTMVHCIADCIMATKMSAAPRNLPEEIICDADTYHLGTTDFKQLDQRVWRELELRLNKPIEDQAGKSLVFLEEHRFYTAYCQVRLSAGKEKNIAMLKEIIQNKVAK
ncbi:MAG TPA: HD domain-containing protein [Chitinophagaceae bacterium]|jgi:predicted metal-dependent HD superfamily phosphohydrolase|nr:HD domain-containing protein [Chitinophagaceae bacterium]